MALTNKKLMPYAETMFLTTRTDHLYLSSSLVRELASFGGDCTDFIPKPIYQEVMKKLKERLGRTNHEH